MTWEPRHPGRWLACVAGAAFVARVAGAGFGLPDVRHPDERLVVERALTMLDTGQLDPHWFAYPTLALYVQVAVLGAIRASARSWLPSLTAGELTTLLYVGGRTATALFGTATVILAYLAAQRLWCSSAGVAAAGFLALSFLHVQECMRIKPDVPSGFFTALSLWLAARAMTGAGDRSLVASGAAAGLAAATKYNAGLCLVVPLASWVIGPRPRRPTTLLLIGLAAALAFCAVMPWVVLDTKEVWAHVSSQMSLYRRGIYGLEGDDNWRFYPTYLWRDGLTPGLALLALLGWGVLSVRDPGRWFVLSIYPVLSYVLLASVRMHATRNLIPVLPYIAAVGGLAAWRLSAWAAGQRWRRWRKTALASALLASVAWPATRIVLYDGYLLKPDTRTVAALWLDTNVPPGATVCRELFTPSPSSERFAVISMIALPMRNIGWYLSGACQYVVTSSFMYGPALRDPGRYPEFAAFYSQVVGGWPLVAEFRYSRSPLITTLLGEQFEFAHPVIRIHRVPSAQHTG